jgi:diguanylate cyclase (GGDEF)-like protein
MQEAEAGADPGGSNQCILLVDDTPANLVALQAALGGCGAMLLTADSGASALELILTRDVSLVLLDVQMPDMDGFEVLRTMRENPRTHSIPVIFLTAYSNDESAIKHGYEYGAIDYILKPISAAILRAKVRQFLELDRYKQGLQRANNQLDRQKAYYESMLNAAGEGVLGLSADGYVEFANPTALRLLNADAQSILGHDFGDFGPRAAIDDKEICAQRLLDTQLHRPDGTTLPVALSCASLSDDNSGMVVVFQDIRYHKLLEEQLRLQAVTDHLTGLVNRHGFKQALQNSIGRATRSHLHLALFFIDLDHFKDINDTMGHDCGDAILCQAAVRLKTVVRAKDTVARLGGDEFTIIIDDLDDAELAALVARKMLNVLNAPFQVQGQTLSLGASIGIALFPDNCNDIESLMLAADLAMYRAKSMGRNVFEYFTDELNVRAKARLLLEQGLRQGLEQQEFRLYYQPQFDIHGNELIGVEALIRWQHNSNGMVAPAVFVPLLEQTGMINAVGEWVIETAAQQRKRWHEARVLPDHCPISINLSPRQFESEKLLPILKRAIEDNQLKQDMLEVELTEGMLMQDVGDHHTHLADLRQLGLRLSIDDFGTGYSSMTYLMQFDIDTLKIDKSFIDHVDTSEKDAAITSSIIQLAHNLHMGVVAEGVETEAQREVLERLGCDYLQGYLFARPMPPDEMVRFLRDRFVARQIH